MPLSRGRAVTMRCPHPSASSGTRTAPSAESSSPRRAIQIGLSRDAVRRYADEWIRSITDITVTARDIGRPAPADRADEATRRLPAERVYPLAPGLEAEQAT